MTLRSDPQRPEPEDKSLVEIRQPSNLASTQDNIFLQRTGFSPAFPSQLAQLNQSLINKGAPIESVGVDMIPGENPSLQYIEQYGRVGYAVSIRSRRTEAYMLITHPGDGVGSDVPPLGITLSDVKDFFSTAFPDTDAELHAFAKMHLRQASYPHPASIFPMPLAKLKTNLYSLEEDFVNSWADFRRGRDTLTYRQVAITRSGQEEPAILADIQLRPDYTGKSASGVDFLVFHPRELLIIDTPEKVEAAMDHVSRLFNKPDQYPYRVIDRQAK